MGIKFSKVNEFNYLSGNLACNGHVLIDLNWLNSIKTRRTQGLRRIIQNQQVKQVTRRLAGESINCPDLQKLINERIAELPHYETIDPKQLTAPIEKPSAKDNINYFCLEARALKSPFLVGFNPVYFEVFHFDPEAQVLIDSSRSDAPAVIMKSGQVVAVIMPIRL